MPEKHGGKVLKEIKNVIVQKVDKELKDVF